ncbi:TolC family protein [Myxococcota bacterium]|nr:TolC family protein [Myxococcota bacterium]
MARRLAFVLCGLATMVTACHQFTPLPLSPEKGAHELASRRLDDSGLVAFLERNGQLGSGTTTAWDLDRLTLAALFFQPALDVARARRSTATAAVETAKARPNPTLALTPERSANPGAAVSPWIAAVQLDWPLETAGKRARRIDRARALEEAGRLDLDVAAHSVRMVLRQALTGLAVADARRERLEEILAAQREAVDMLDARVRAGAAALADVAPARAALVQLTADADDAERRARESRVRVATAIGVSVRAIEGKDLLFSLEDEGSDLLGVAADEARDRALLSRSDVLAALARFRAAEAALRLELARQYPDVHLGNGFQYDQGQRKWMLGVSLELPLLNRNQGGIAEAEAVRREAAAAFLTLQAQVLGELERTLSIRAAARDEVLRLRDLVATQDAAFRRTRAALALGAVDRLSLAIARAERARARLLLVEALGRLQQTLGELEAALQAPLPWPDALEPERPLFAGGSSP